MPAPTVIKLKQCTIVKAFNIVLEKKATGILTYASSGLRHRSREKATGIVKTKSYTASWAGLVELLRKSSVYWLGMIFVGWRIRSNASGGERSYFGGFYASVRHCRPYRYESIQQGEEQLLRHAFRIDQGLSFASIRDKLPHIN